MSMSFSTKCISFWGNPFYKINKRIQKMMISVGLQIMLWHHHVCKKFDSLVCQNPQIYDRSQAIFSDHTAHCGGEDYTMFTKMQSWQMDAEASTNKHEQADESSRDGELPSWRRTSAGAEAKRGGETTLLRPSPWPARGGNKTGPGAPRLDARFGESGWRAAGADKSPSAPHEIWVGRPRVDTWTYDRRIGRQGGRGSLHKLPRGPLTEKLLKSCHVIPYLGL